MTNRALSLNVLRAAWLMAATAFASEALAYTDPPSAPAFSADGNYTVTFTDYGCSHLSSCLSQWLEEKVGSGGWQQVADAGRRSKAYTDKPENVYSYRLVRLVAPYYVPDASTAITVHVTPQPPAADPLLVQREYAFRTRVGDIDGDGRKDLFVWRSSGGKTDNGVLDRVILRQPSTGTRFQPVVPTATQASVASSWPRATAKLVVEDVDVDGFVDIVVKGVGKAVGKASLRDQIVYSSGAPFVRAPKTIRVVDDDLLRFTANMFDYQVNDDYFVEHAPIVYYSVTYVQSNCFDGSYDPDPIFGSYPGSCFYTYRTAYGYYPDYSQFSNVAVATWNDEKAVRDGTLSMSTGVDRMVTAVEDLLETPIGGWKMEDLLGESGPHTNALLRKSVEVFTAILGIGRANAGEIDTDEAPHQAPRTGNSIYLTKRRIFFFGDHSALEHNTNASIPCLTNAVHCETISAFPVVSYTSGLMEYVENAARDTPHLMMTVSTVEKPGFGPELLWAELRRRAEHYNTERVWYHFNCPGTGRYNSNGFLHGLINSVQAFSNYDMDKLWCGDKPVPPLNFQ